MPWGKNQYNNNHLVCSLCQPGNIFIDPLPRQKVEVLLEEYPHTEWLGYLVGKGDENSGDVFVWDITIPPHVEVSGASCEAEPFHIPKRCVGILHSHHSMGAFHSGQDNHTVDRNFPVSITVAKKGNGNNVDYNAVAYVVTPCKKKTVMPATVKFLNPKPLFDKEKFIEGAKRNIEKGRKVASYCTSERPIIQSNESVYIVDNTGRVITQEEYKKVMKEIWKDEKEEK